MATYKAETEKAETEKAETEKTEAEKTEPEKHRQAQEKPCPITLPPHGGNIPWASKQFAIPENQWIDLSTGISPWHYPISTLSPRYFQQLPYATTQLYQAAANYYGCPAEYLRAVPGSQYAIEQLPTLFAPQKIALPTWGYSEHQKAWQAQGSEIIHYTNHSELLQLLNQQAIPYALIIRPNNPSAAFFTIEQVKQVEVLLQQKYPNKHLLILDEAFIDLYPQASFIRHPPGPRTVVLRSVGKFFGLAGIRLGFVCAQPALLQRLQAKLGQWLINGPSVGIGQQLFQDKPWAQQQRLRIRQQNKQLQQCLLQAGLPAPLHSAGLFTSVFGEPEKFLQIFIQLAKAGVLVRYFPHPTQACLRFGLPGQHQQACFTRIKGLLHA